MRPQVVRRRAEKSAGYIVVVDTLEEAEEARVVIVRLEMGAVDDGGDSTYDSSGVVQRDQWRNRAVNEERIAPGKQRVFLVATERRHPIAAIAIDLIRKSDEPLAIGGSANHPYLYSACHD